MERRAEWSGRNDASAEAASVGGLFRFTMLKQRAWRLRQSRFSFRRRDRKIQPSLSGCLVWILERLFRPAPRVGVLACFRPRVAGFRATQAYFAFARAKARKIYQLPLTSPHARTGILSYLSKSIGLRHGSAASEITPDVQDDVHLSAVQSDLDVFACG
jgi:hypothetical protein